MHAWFKVTRAEYVLLVLGFLSILIWGLEGGIAIGIVLATLYFAFAYARVRCLNRISDSCDGTIASVGDIHFLHTFKGEGLPN